MFLKTLFQHYILFIFIFCTASYLTAQKSDVGSINNAFLVFYFPQLSEISAGIDKNAPLIKESRQYIEESKSNRLIADSAKGLSVNFNLSGQSIHENRPGQSYNQTYRTVGSIFVKKPLYNWGILDSKSRIAELAESYAIQKTDSVH